MASAGDRIADRYRLEAQLGCGSQGELWRASDQWAGEAPVVLRRIGADQPELQQRFRRLWPQLQAVLHPQVPRVGELIDDPASSALWLVREWQEGRSFAELLEARRERQLVFGAGEVLFLLRQLLPVLAVLHAQQVLHGDLSPANLLRRERDGLPVLLDFGLVRGLCPVLAEGQAPLGVTPGYGPPELCRGEPAEPWMDLYSLGVVALVLLSGEEPAQLLDPVTMEWRWPAALAQHPLLRQALARLLSPDPTQRLSTAAEALHLLQQLPMPESTGPVPRADRTVVLLPQLPVAAAAAGHRTVAPLRSRQEEREEAAEGRLWPMVLALLLSAVVGTGLGWLVLSRGKGLAPGAGNTLQLPSSLPPGEVDQRQQLLNRLRALQIDQGWFVKLVDASLLAQYPERGGRLPGDGLDDAPLRKVWNELAEEWLSRVEQLPLELRMRLGSFSSGDWRRRQAGLVAQGLSPSVVEQLVSGSAQNLLPGRAASDIPPEPFRQLWFAAAEKALANVRIEAIVSRTGQTSVVSATVESGGARLFPIRLPGPSRLVLGVNGSPLMQMTVFGADGRVLEARGPLRVVSLNRVTRSPVQLLITNEGLAPAMITLSLRPDPLLELQGGSDGPGSGAEPLTPPPLAAPQSLSPGAGSAASDDTAAPGSSASPTPPPPPVN